MYKAVSIIAVGTRFGKLVVLGSGEKGKDGRSTVKCVCDCGVERDFKAYALTSGGATTCAKCPRVAHPNSIAAVSKANKTHGATNTTEWHIWQGIRRRCLDVNDKAYYKYGGRGITVCQSWADSFEAFYADMGPKPSKEYSIDRKDNDRGYSKENCRWATKQEQNRNRRTVIMVDGPNGRVPLIELAQSLGLPWMRVRDRYNAGWSLEDALNKPKMR